MGQRLGITAALPGGPEILMSDQPVNGLNPEGIHRIRNPMKGLVREGRTIFIPSLPLSEMTRAADRLPAIRTGNAPPTCRGRISSGRTRAVASACTHRGGPWVLAALGGDCPAPGKRDA